MLKKQKFHEFAQLCSDVFYAFFVTRKISLNYYLEIASIGSSITQISYFVFPYSVFVTKNDNRFNVYVDDKHINESGGIFLQENNGNNEIPAPSNKGLYIGGIPYLLRDVVEKANLIGSVNGLVGTIGDVVFIDDM